MCAGVEGGLLCGVTQSPTAGQVSSPAGGAAASAGAAVADSPAVGEPPAPPWPREGGYDMHKRWEHSRRITPEHALYRALYEMQTLVVPWR